MRGRTRFNLLFRVMSFLMTFSMMFTLYPASSLTTNAAETTEEITELIEETTEEVTEEVTEETTEEATEEVTEETTEEATEETTEVTTEESIQEEELEDELEADGVTPNGITPNYLTFTAAEAGSTITLGWRYGTDIMYSVDGGKTWIEYIENQTLTLSKVGDSVKFKGENIETSISSYDNSFNMTGKIKASGSVTSLTDGNGGDPNVELTDRCYKGMFNDCESLIEAPELPATKLASYCYCEMFHGCYNLTEAPKLPATTLAMDCYSGMFAWCINLKKAPELPATTLALECYENMFDQCTKLVEAPKLPATTLAASCYLSMFSDCTSLTKAPELPATTLDYHCYEFMFSGCSGLTDAPKLPATTLSYECYLGMFSHCKSLKYPPELPAKKLAEGCYKGMFSQCEKLKTIPELPATILADNCYGGVDDPFPNEGMFEGCKSLSIKKTKDSEHQKVWKIPASVAAMNWNTNMFKDCPNVEITEPQLGVTYYLYSHTHVYKDEIVKATLSKDGLIKRKCPNCGDVLSTEIIPAASKISIDNTKYIYNGKDLKPNVKVADKNGNIIDVKNYTITYDKNCKTVGTHNVIVTLKGNRYEGTQKFSYTINPNKTSLKSVKSGKKFIKLTWNKKTQEVSGYEIQYSTSSSFKKAKKIAITSNKTNSKTIKNLKSGKKYYVRIRTYKKVGSKKYYSEWSAKKSVKVK